MERQRKRILLNDEVPSPANPPTGCVFHIRCPIAGPECSQIQPESKEIFKDHMVACIKADQNNGSLVPIEES